MMRNLGVGVGVRGLLDPTEDDGDSLSRRFLHG